MSERFRISLIWYLCVTAIVSTGFAFPYTAHAAREETVVARGIVEFSGKKETGREQALSDAFRQAVRQALGVLIESESLVLNQILVNDRILSRSSGYIKKYTIIEEKELDGVYTVDIRAVVASVKLEKALGEIGLISRKMGKPRILMLITERGSDGRSSAWGDGVAGNRIQDLLVRKGFEFVERGAAAAAFRGEPGVSEGTYSPSPEALAKIARSGDAGVIFVGSATSRASTAAVIGTSIYPCQATVTVKAVNADDGEVLATHTAQASAPHVNPAAGEADALGKAAEEVAERLAQKITKNWKGKVEGVKTLRLVVSGLAGYDELKLFKETLKKNIEDVEEIWERSFDAGTAKIDLEIAGSSRIVTDLLSTLKVRGKQVNIISFTSNTVNLTIGSPKKRGTN